MKAGAFLCGYSPLKSVKTILTYAVRIGENPTGINTEVFVSISV